MYKRGALAKVLEDQTFDLKAGQWTAPIRTRQGYVILKVTEHQDAGVAPLKDVEPQIQEAMYTEAMQPALRAYLTKLREDAYIDIRAGLCGLRLRAVKRLSLVFTAYTPPVVKKKKVAQEKKRFDRGTKYSTVAKSSTQPAATTAAGAAANSGRRLAQQRLEIRSDYKGEGIFEAGEGEAREGAVRTGSAQIAARRRRMRLFGDRRRSRSDFGSGNDRGNGARVCSWNGYCTAGEYLRRFGHRAESSGCAGCSDRQDPL